MRVTDSKSFGSAIRNRRKELGYTQRDLSEFSGLSISFLSDLERGKKTIELEKALYVISILGLNLNLEPRSTSELI